MFRTGAVDVLAAAALAAALAAGAGCGYEGTNQVREVPSDELFGLDETTTTSTTTTTTTTTTTMPPPIDSAVTTTTVLATTTTAIATVSVALYFVDGEQLTSISQNLSSPASLSRVLDALELGPTGGEAVIGLDSAVPRGLVDTVSERSGVAVVDLDSEVYERVPSDEQLPAIAQIVLTLTQQSGVGQVRFTLDGETLPVRLGNNRITDPPRPVSADDYAVLLGEEVPVTVPPSEPTPPTTPSTPVTVTTAE